jgi:hypothetical protein
MRFFSFFFILLHAGCELPNSTSTRNSTATPTVSIHPIELVIERFHSSSYRKTTVTDSLILKSISKQARIRAFFELLINQKHKIDYCCYPTPPDFKLIFKLSNDSIQQYWVDTTFYANKQSVIVFPYGYNRCTRLERAMWQNILIEPNITN